MKYFLDFEAAQFSGHIISVGCVREDGVVFSSLVKHKGGRISGFIEDLTGITEAMLEEAPSSEEVFSDMLKWFNEDSNPTFFVWGKEDKNFITRTINHCYDEDAVAMLWTIHNNLVNYEAQFKTLVKRGNTCFALIKAARCFDETAQQTHKALDDAKLLKFVYDHADALPASILKEKVAKYDQSMHAPAPAQIQNPYGAYKWNNSGLPSGTLCAANKNGYLIRSFSSLDEAIDWVFEKYPMLSDDICREEIGTNIMKRTNMKYTKAGYYGAKWRIIV